MSDFEKRRFDHSGERGQQEEIYSNAVRAGRRTYFFDVRSTRKQDYYLTITESKRNYNDDGTFRYQKHKIFLYKEDFEKFSDAIADAIRKVIELNTNKTTRMAEEISDNLNDMDFSSIEKPGARDAATQDLTAPSEKKQSTDLTDVDKVESDIFPGDEPQP